VIDAGGGIFDRWDSPYFAVRPTFTACSFSSQLEGGGTPTPGCFCQRVRNRLKIKELSFRRVQKSAQECEKKELEYCGE